MIKKWNSLTLVFLILTILAIGAALDNIFWPKLVQAGQKKTTKNTSLNQWEYKVIGGARDLGELLGEANMLGAQGWELISISKLEGYDIVALLKRPKS